MKDIYRYGSSKHIAPHEKLGIRLKFLIIAIVIILVGSGVVIYDVYSKSREVSAPISKTTVRTVDFDTHELSTPYFWFTDSENWKFIDKESTGSKFTFRKYLGKSDIVQHQLFVYVNATPIPLELAATRVLPVNIKNGHSLEGSEVSDLCVGAYGAQELHKVLPKKVSNAILLCDPGSTQYKVVIAQNGGDYNLKLRRSDGSTANYIIIYQNQKINPDDATVLQIAASLQAR